MTDNISVLTESSVGGLPIQPVAEQDFTFNLMVHGNPGVGKTVFGASASIVPEMSPVLCVDVEGGTMSARDRYPDLDVVRVASWDDMQLVYDGLRKGEGGYRTVMLDSLTEIQKFSMYGIMKQLIADPKTSDRDPDVPGMREWGKNTEQTRKLIRAFRDLPINTIFTALTMAEKDNKTGTILHKPSLSGKLSNEAAAFLDIVVYMYIKVIDDRQERLLLTTGTETQVAKDRTDRLPVVVEQPTMQKIQDYLTRETQ